MNSRENGIIIAQLYGGLGNQMFIYATARALSLRTNSKLVLDLKTGFVTDIYKRKFALGNFKLKIDSASKIQSFDYPGGKYLKILSNKLTRHIPLFYIKIINEKNFKFNHELISGSRTNYYINGYWQTEKYFCDFKNDIAENFQIIKPISSKTMEEENRYLTSGENLVALCVRRYQEVENFVNLSLTNEEYYLNAMRLMSSKISDPVFICFTQDRKWVEQNLCNHFNIHFAEPKEDEGGDIEDLYLMKSFKNFIISNSSYYWWGVWLANNESKFVIAPKNWISPNTPLEDWIII
jgi:hypothetical protein